mmetsp:Transcript_34841/g.74269  ORF Transcript_34841/g.74269 Transcript_34841/m.74269 type:complete len:252 (+) Transcript_34841:93-848(+)|eukprot:CAMPEP_0172553832 /NCGR_PEP_ID=MMETSP1067-20121228/51888_1 /TAXON_ID=265564 ORGANISM="Thalassiosira punctigera, Strain Tpunct2005C2" /NCGR_SAMPLE_ID=MMETSP1067 /ASSEMBLY_ACC=CAM_ASM_000444 /LENGTH=251 /DNA_ID=CAMNT_0013342071 /DNA_START=69 /DNA_END=824 /DNA_ORIENTATION=-
MRAQLLLHLRQLLFLFLVCLRFDVAKTFTYEPPGRDPVSIDEILSSEMAVPLTADNFDELTKGKLVFIKFFAPYCPHCKSIAGAWNELAKYYDELPNSDDIVIGSIDCTNSPAGKDLCGRFKIVGLPTLLYGDANFGGIYLEEYGGDKTFDELKSFAAEALMWSCNPGNLDACTPDMRKDTEVFMAMSYEALDGLIKGKEKQQDDIQTSFKNMYAKLQKNYDQSLLEKELQIAKAKANVKLIKEIIDTKDE